MVGIDLSAFFLINNLAGRNHLLDMAMVVVAKFGPVAYGIILVWLWFWGPGREKAADRRTIVILAVASAFIGLGVNQLISFCYFRPRPFAEHVVHLLIDRSPDPSFPSDHATGAFSLATSLVLYHRKTGLFSLGFAVLLGFSRVYVGTHYPSDVIGGAATGLISTAIVYLLRNKLKPLTRLILCTWDKIVHLARAFTCN